METCYIVMGWDKNAIWKFGFLVRQLVHRANCDIQTRYLMLNTLI